MKDDMITHPGENFPRVTKRQPTAEDRISAIEERLDTMERIMGTQNDNIRRVISVLENMKLRS